LSTSRHTKVDEDEGIKQLQFKKEDDDDDDDDDGYEDDKDSY
jgi:hypothetical protein